MDALAGSLWLIAVIAGRISFALVIGPGLIAELFGRLTSLVIFMVPCPARGTRVIKFSITALVIGAGPIAEIFRKLSSTLVFLPPSLARCKMQSRHILLEELCKVLPLALYVHSKLQNSPLIVVGRRQVGTMMC